VADSTTFKVSKTIAAALLTVKPGGIRELHWHPNAAEWQYYLAGQGRMTVIGAGPRVQTADFRPGDIGYAKKSNAHFIEEYGFDRPDPPGSFQGPVLPRSAFPIGSPHPAGARCAAPEHRSGGRGEFQNGWGFMPK